MLKKLIIIENENKCQFDSEEELVKELIDDNYYELSEIEKLEKMKIKAIANTINNGMKILEQTEITNKTDLKNKFILIDEFTYVLSLLATNKVILLEHIEANIFTKTLDKSQFTKNYIIVNNFASGILEKYVKNKVN